MATTLNFNTGNPPHKGYYLVRWIAKWRLNGRQKDLFPWAEYWNGKTWQDMSDDDAFNADGNMKPCEMKCEAVMVEWCEVKV